MRFRGGDPARALQGVHGPVEYAHEHHTAYPGGDGGADPTKTSVLAPRDFRARVQSMMGKELTEYTPFGSRMGDPHAVLRRPPYVCVSSATIISRPPRNRDVELKFIYADRHYHHRERAMVSTLQQE